MAETPFSQFFDHVAVINLPSRPDRLASIRRECARLGIAPDRVEVPDAPVPEGDGGFSSRGVHGNYLSHLGILKDAEAAGARCALVLEDDAIFSRAAQDPARQAEMIAQANTQSWATWHLGHKLRRELAGAPKGVIPNDMPFVWAHAYAVHGESLAELIAFLETLMSRPAGHPDGGRMYIDGALYTYRTKGASKPCLVSNPSISIQKGSDSNLAGPKRPGEVALRH
ncbi:MAG: LPS biosynthesis glycosyltransferase, partial [Pseudomonadota bacterium]